MKARVLSMLLASMAAVACSAFPSSGTLYVSPSGNPFIENQGETVIPITVASGSIADAQAQLDSAHAANPGAIVVLSLPGGTYTVTTAPLTLSSHTCLILGANTIIQADGTATAPALIQVAGQTNVGIAGGSLLGNGVALNAIRVTGSNRVNIDGVVVQNFGADGITVTGNGNTTFDNENTVTRCQVSGCIGNGIAVSSGTQAIVIDNVCSGNSGSGIALATARSTAANNRCTGNGIGISAAGSFNKVSDNTVDSNATGIAFVAGGANNLAASNDISNSSTVGVSDAGTNDTVFQTVFSSNANDLSATGTGANIFAWRGALGAGGQNYFYPPLIDDQHSLATIENGLGRFDLTIGDDTLADVQTQYSAAIAAHPNTVIVLHLTGTYSVTSTALKLSSNTVVLLSGTIQETTSSTVSAAVAAASGAANIAFSGGIVDGGGRTTTNGIDFSGAKRVWIHGTTVQNFGVPSTRSGNSNGLIKFSSMKGATFVSSCTTVNSGTRGIWLEGNGPYVVTDCQSHKNNMDGVDCDFTTQEALVKDNDCTANTRYGVFIEQGAQLNVAYGNLCKSELSKGINVFNNAEPSSLTVQFNTVFCNILDHNPNGLRSGSGGTGSDGTTTLTSHNFFFNNTVTNSSGNGIQSNQTGVQNYYSQTFLAGNSSAIATSGAEAFFNPSTPLAVAATPTFSPGPGAYTSPQTIALATTTAGASIRYTLDGSIPSETNGTLYSSPIVLSSSKAIRAVAFASGMADSAIATGIYQITDVTPPVLSLPANITVEATGPSGTTVEFAATAVDDFDGNVPVTLTPASGSVFPVGTTTVVATAKDSAGNVATGSFTVTVTDTTPPTIQVPANLTLEATSPNGASATFSATAMDLVDGAVPVVATPASGSTFPLGTTTVNLTATDAHGNVAHASFTVTVEDTTPPAITSLSASPSSIWPPNKKMVSVTLSAIAADAVGVTSLEIVSVATTEPDGNRQWQITGPSTLNLLADRLGTGSGRVYTITVEARDAAGNASTRSVPVSVPHNQ